MRPLRSIVVAGIAAGLLVPAVAHAKGAKKSHSSSPAGQLLAEGRHLMAQGNYAEACPKIADSQSQAPSSATAMTLGSCYEKAGKLASAWAAYRTASESASAAGKNKMVAAAKHAIAAIEPKLSRITIKTQDPSGVDVKIDGDEVQETDLGNAVPRDGGGHDVEATEAGKKPWKKHVELADSGQTLEVSIPRLEDDRPAVAATSAPSSAEGAPSSSPSDEAAPSSSRGNGQRIAGIAVGAAGIVAIAVGAYAGLHAKSLYNEALGACGGTTACGESSDGLTLRHQAGTWATASTAMFIVGGAAVAGGVVLYVTAPHAKEASPQSARLGIAPASLGTGLSLVGTF